MRVYSIIASIFLVVLFIVIGVQSAAITDTNGQLLLTKYDLNTAKINLDKTKSLLNYTETKLTNTEMALLESKLHLDNTQQQLITLEDELQLTGEQLSTTENQLEETESLLSVTEHRLEAVEDEKEYMLNGYSNIRNQIHLRFGQGEGCKQFITPDDEKVSKKASAIAGYFTDDPSEIWNDYDKLYRWIVNNIEYSHDSYLPYIPFTLGGDIEWRQECWKMPEETLEDGFGDCEDMALLLTSLLLSYNLHTYGVWAIEISGDNGGHLAVAFPVADNNLAILDPAGNYYTGYTYGSLRSDDINRAVNDWLSHWKQKMPGAEISAIFSDNFYQEFENTEEFISWVKEH
jgi:hypothetical protein